MTYVRATNMWHNSPINLCVEIIVNMSPIMHHEKIFQLKIIVWKKYILIIDDNSNIILKFKK